MPIVTYARLFNLGNYENERIELSDEVGPDETLEQAYARVMAWVYAQKEISDSIRRGEVQRDADEIPF